MANRMKEIATDGYAYYFVSKTEKGFEMFYKHYKSNRFIHSGTFSTEEEAKEMASRYLEP